MKKCILTTLLMVLIPLVGSAQTFPASEWEEAQNPTGDGWDGRKFQQLAQFVTDSTSLTGLVIVHKGKIIGNYGNTEENSYIASCRKSVLAMLFGKYVQSGVIDLDKTLEALGIDDVGTLQPLEKQASIKDIVSARSGVYHPASNGGDFLEFAPERGSKKPGEYWLYSNWDFNVAGYIFEQETGKNIYDEIEEQLAIPLQMQDWNRDIQQYHGDPGRSKFMAYHMWFSTRDMARLGLLMLHKGKWNGKQVLSSAWVDEMVRERSDNRELNENAPPLKEINNEFSYGYMWWLWDNQTDPRFEGAYSAMGALGQTITVFPAIDTVVAYKTNNIYQRSTSAAKRVKVLQMIAEAYTKK